MPTYGFRCQACGPFEQLVPMARSAEPRPCPTCGSAAGRIITATAGLARTSAQRTMRDRAERSAHEPAVVSRVPPARTVAAPTRNPRQAKLPRP